MNQREGGLDMVVLRVEEGKTVKVWWRCFKGGVTKGCKCVVEVQSYGSETWIQVER